MIMINDMNMKNTEMCDSYLFYCSCTVEITVPVAVPALMLHYQSHINHFYMKMQRSLFLNILRLVSFFVSYTLVKPKPKNNGSKYEITCYQITIQNII